MKRLLFKLTTVRYDQAFKLIQEIKALATGEYRFVVTTEPDVPILFREYCEADGIEIHWQNEHKTKVDAINDNMPDDGWDILVNLSDDQRFTVMGFDEQIMELCGSDTFLHIPDGNRADFATMSIMGKKYYNRDWFIYDPRFESLYCDNWATVVAKKRECYKFANINIMQHLHPTYGTAKNDLIYVKNKQSLHKDRQTLAELMKTI
jgi:hypothetical protein